MTSFGNALSETPHRRERSRLATHLPARVTTLHETRTATLVDISLTGARLLAPSDLAIFRGIGLGCDVLLEWSGFEAFGTIVWSSAGRWDGELGMAFDRMIASTVLIATRDMQDEYVRLGGTGHDLRESARNWVEGSR
ncbi:PilZ domain-containing protein [Parerythrobacter lacustris]|uniref:PilZ domain-containing protein n=1 Tax=Parerythrobacter lacustris TaxID=2969984 RepID=A0ABT1XN06_9SPHN|nr:PilZ domain-containing protein [Parerythrobacter lacustris]MCR2833028.1 PilZ domain-containing protein [Parerythrobacter lacustris]